MSKTDFTLSAILAVMLAGCTSTAQISSFSTGGKLLVNSNISSAYDLKNYADAQTKAASISQQTNSSLMNTDLLFGSGLVGSTVFFAEHGVWLNPSNFLDKASLGFFAADFLLGKGMRHHPWTYTYFFNQSATCDARDCVEDNFEAFTKDVMAGYLKHPAGKYKASSVKEIEYARSNILIDRFTVFGSFHDPKLERNPHWSLIHVSNLDRVNSSPTPLWGNADPTEYQDHIGLPGLNYEETVSLMLEASTKHPEILVYVGIDRERQKNKLPCFGGFFIQAGQTIPVDEIGCMQSADKKS
jgi:outer membrane murein-binding lipoprotein Lpp